LIVAGIACFGSLAINFAVGWVLYLAANGLPEPHKSQVGPGQAFLMMIPLFNLVWLFIYPKKLSQAYQICLSGYSSQNDDCGEQIGLYWAICSVCTLIPCVNLFTGIAAIILAIIYLIKIHECKNRLQPLLQGGIPMATPMPENPYGDAAGPNQDNPYGPTDI
ncbi:MAG: hypothetical protein AAGG44_07810, partial [Planctomycetota bacterium]